VAPRRGHDPGADEAAAAGPPPSGASTETYLRLRAEAELRRALALPRYDAPEDGGQEERAAGDALHRLRTVANALARAGTIDRGTADSVMDDLEIALAARSRIDPHESNARDLLRSSLPGQPARAPAGPYLAVPVGATVPGAPGGALAEIRLFTLVIAPDRAVLTAAGRVRKPLTRRRHREHRLPFAGSGQPAATDDRGNSYHLHEEGSSEDSDGNWSSLIGISPVPPAGTRWLELTMSPGSPPVRVGLTGPATGTAAAPAPTAAASAAERLVDTAAERLLLTALIDGEESARWHDLSEITDVVTALEAVGSLGPARAAVGRLVNLAGRLGTQIPPALSALALPTALRAAWDDILRNRDRDDGPAAVAPAATVLPELDGTRFVLAGLRSGAAGAELQALAWGWQQVPHFFFFEDAVNQWSWSARDDQGRWHLATEGGGSSDDRHASIELQFVPALHPDARSLEVTLACPAGQVSATVPLDWWE
jgi:hypothetical protein